MKNKTVGTLGTLGTLGTNGTLGQKNGNFAMWDSGTVLLYIHYQLIKTIFGTSGTPLSQGRDSGTPQKINCPTLEHRDTTVPKPKIFGTLFKQPLKLKSMKKSNSLTESHAFALSYNDSCELIERATEANLSVSDFIRKSLGFQTLAEIKAGNPVNYTPKINK